MGRVHVSGPPAHQSLQVHDSSYMVPPFLAYYSVVSNDISYMREAQTQISLYSDLLNSEGAGRHLWRNSVNIDPKFSSKANGLVVAGLVRVLATSKKWTATRSDEDFHLRLTQMIGWAISGAMAAENQARGGLLRSFFNEENGGIGHMGGTALLASVMYRMVVLEPEIFGKKEAKWAEEKSKAVFAHVDKKTGIASSVSGKGGQAIDQSCVVLLYAAQRDYLAWEKESLGKPGF